jgi:hypothetical protein
MNDQLVAEIRDSLRDDMASYGFLIQCIKTASNRARPSRVQVRQILERILAPGDVCIGKTSLANPNYVTFIGWQGDASELIERAFRAVDSATEQDKPFAFWLCLQSNVDQYENR